MNDDAVARPPSDPEAAAFFQSWQTYRKIVDNNYLFHREAYAALHRVLAGERPAPFSFLDLACGDAEASAGALAGTQVAFYRGIDSSGAALALAERNLAGLPCPVALETRDFVDALGDSYLSADVVWIGLSLHHFRTDSKRAIMESIRRVVGDRGLFLIFENTSPDGEDRAQWLRRWDAQRPFWTAYSEAEWRAACDHVHEADFPETVSTWRSLGRDAGFGRVRQLYRSPTDLFRLFAFDS